jgi:hypothetical protein
VRGHYAILLNTTEKSETQTKKMKEDNAWSKAAAVQPVLQLYSLKHSNVGVNAPDCTIKVAQN